MGYKRSMTHEEHLILGAHLSAVKKILQDVHIALANNVSKSSSPARSVLKARGHLDKACCELDALYHSVTTDEQFEKHGHVYYGGKPQ